LKNPQRCHPSLKRGKRIGWGQQPPYKPDNERKSERRGEQHRPLLTVRQIKVESKGTKPCDVNSTEKVARGETKAIPTETKSNRVI